ncbi:MAG: PAS domain S-box protein, partial [Acidobacteria bacterium]|nr:PAS domain S-box protein [Acidobacteriota bacterium]
MRNTRHPAGGRRKADAYLRQVMDGLGPHMFVGVMTVDGTLVEANRPALAAAGLALEDVLGKPFDETYWWSYAEPVQRQLRAAIARAADGIASRYDVQVRAADGQMIDIDFSLQPLRDEAGAVALLVPSAVVITDRKRSERALRESEATFARILEAIPSGVVLVSPTGDITLANAAAERLAGVAPGGMAGRRFDDPVWQFFSMDGRPVPDDQRLFTRVLRTGQPQYGAEMAARRGDGTTLILSINAAPMYDAEGTLAGVVGAFRDITDRKRAEEALRGSEERLRLALDAARMGTFDWDIPYSRITWSRRHEELWGLPPGGFDGSYEAFAAGVHPGDLPRVNAAIAECIAARSGFQLEFRVVWPDGSVRSILARGAFTFDATGRPARMTGVAMDTTEQHAAMDALRESEERLRLFIEHAPAALAMFDRDMRYLAASRRWLADYRLGQRDVIGRSHYDVFPEIPERWRLVHGRGMAGETVRSDEDAFERADGTVQYLRWEVRPWHAADGAVGGIVIFTEDISDRKRTEAAMRRGAARLRLALDAALMGIFDWDVPHNRITWSRRHEALWGFAPGEFAGTYEAFASRVHPGDLPGVNEEVARCIAARAPFNREFRVVWPDGSVHWVSGRGEFEFDAGGQPRRMRGVTVEVTARRLADEALRESRERLARIVATDASGIVVVDTSGTITLANPAVERMAGLLPGSMAGRSA